MTTDTKIRKRTCLKCKQEKEEWNYKYTQSPYFPGHRSMICTACYEKMVRAEDFDGIDRLCR